MIGRRLFFRGKISCQCGMVSWKLFQCRMGSPQQGRGLFLRGIEWSCNYYFTEWSHDGVGGLFRMWKSLLCGNSEVTIISRNGGSMTGHEGFFFSVQNRRMRNCHLGSPAVLSLRSARTKTGERGGGKRGGEIWREILCARSLAHSLARSICGSCDLRNQTCATRHLFSY